MNSANNPRLVELLSHASVVSSNFATDNVEDLLLAKQIVRMVLEQSTDKENSKDLELVIKQIDLKITDVIIKNQPISSKPKLPWKYFNKGLNFQREPISQKPIFNEPPNKVMPKEFNELTRFAKETHSYRQFDQPNKSNSSFFRANNSTTNPKENPDNPFSTGLDEFNAQNEKHFKRGLHQNYRPFQKEESNNQVNNQNGAKNFDTRVMGAVHKGLFPHSDFNPKANNNRSGPMINQNRPKAVGNANMMETDNQANTNLSKRREFKPPVKGNNQPQNEVPEEKTELELFAEKEGLDMKLVQLIEHEIIDKKPMTTWNDIAGLDGIKKIINETIIYPALRPDIFSGLRAPSKGILLFGPPGTGKTMIGRAIAGQLQSTFFSISSSSLVSKWVGESEKLIKTLFRLAVYYQPSVIFVDEVDSLLSVRGENEMDCVRRIKTEFFIQLDGARTDENEKILVIGTTNRPEQLDEAARRRFTRKLYVPLPCKEARKELILGSIEKEKKLNFKIVLSDEELESVLDVSKGYSCADITNVLKEASMGPVREMIESGNQASFLNLELKSLRPVYYKDFCNALKQIKSSVSPDEIERYKSWNDKFGQFEVDEID